MWGHPIFLIGAGVAAIVTIVAAVATAYKHHRRQQCGQYLARPEPTMSAFERRVIGPCCMCKGDVSTLDGYYLDQCKHLIHYTCASDISREFRDVPFQWSQVCRACLNERMKNKNRTKGQNRGLRNRAPVECATCLRPFESVDGDIKTLECNHRVHEECWKRMEHSGSTTCPTCMET